jgi:hypothetical protein
MDKPVRPLIDFARTVITDVVVKDRESHIGMFIFILVGITLAQVLAYSMMGCACPDNTSTMTF